MEKPEVKRRRGKTGRRWEYKTTTVLQEIGGQGVKWIYLAQDRNMLWATVNTIMSLWVP
jgi:hypothetical protein